MLGSYNCITVLLLPTLNIWFCKYRFMASSMLYSMLHRVSATSRQVLPVSLVHWLGMKTPSGIQPGSGLMQPCFCTFTTPVDLTLLQNGQPVRSFAALTSWRLSIRDL